MIVRWIILFQSSWGFVLERWILILGLSERGTVPIVDLMLGKVATATRRGFFFSYFWWPQNLKRHGFPKFESSIFDPKIDPEIDPKSPRKLADLRWFFFPNLDARLLAALLLQRRHKNGKKHGKKGMRFDIRFWANVPSNQCNNFRCKAPTRSFNPVSISRSTNISSMLEQISSKSAVFQNEPESSRRRSLRPQYSWEWPCWLGKHGLLAFDVMRWSFVVEKLGVPSPVVNLCWFVGRWM